MPWNSKHIRKLSGTKYLGFLFRCYCIFQALLANTRDTGNKCDSVVKGFLTVGEALDFIFNTTNTYTNKQKSSCLLQNASCVS